MAHLAKRKSLTQFQGLFIFLIGRNLAHPGNRTGNQLPRVTPRPWRLTMRASRLYSGKILANLAEPASGASGRKARDATWIRRDAPLNPAPG